MWSSVKTVLVAMAVMLWPLAVLAQEFSVSERTVLVIDPARLFAETEFGRRVATEVEAEGAVLAAENRRIEAELTTEEKALTERRKTMAPDEFRAAADGFDRKVQQIRSEQEAKARALADAGENAQRRFLSVAQPVLETLMRESGAEVMLDRRFVLLRDPHVDVTEEAVRRIDEAIGDGREYLGTSVEPDEGTETQDPSDANGAGGGTE
ncbi:MAG: outer membrane chaperone Skp [Rhodobacterales bacterium]|nr:MAG: outer membrane chaperone Skp [Rhodobacterales bacterium]